MIFSLNVMAGRLEEVGENERDRQHILTIASFVRGAGEVQGVDEDVAQGATK